MSDTAAISPPPPLPAPPRAVPGAARAFGGIWRLTCRRFFTPNQMLVLGVLLAVLALLTMAANRRGNPREFFDWVIFFHLTFLVPVLSFVSGGGSIRDDMQASTVDYVFTRPVSRRAFVPFRYLSQMACVQVNCLLALGVLIAIGFWRGVPGLAAALPVLVLAQILTVATFTAFGFLCGTWTARYLIAGIAYGGAVEAGVGSIPTKVNDLSLIHHVHAMLAPITPWQRHAPAPESPLTTTLVFLTVTAVMIAVAAIVFSRAEMAGARQKES